MIKVLVYAANSIVRAGLESLLGSQPTLALAGSVSDWETLRQRLTEQQADVLLLEGTPNALDPFWEQGLFPQIESSPAVVILAPVVERERVLEALKLGVQAYLPSSATATELVAVLQAVVAELVVLHPDVSELLLEGNLGGRHSLSTEAIEALSAREIEVLQLLAVGLGNKAIASRLNLSEHTVKFHLGSIFAKLRASSRTEAVTLGLRLGLIWL